MLKMKCFLILIVFFTISANIAYATVINVPDDQPTIQRSLNGALESDTVLVQPKTYIENITWPSVNGIKLLSAGDSSNVIIDGDSTSSVITFQGLGDIDTTTVIRGFRITNGGDVDYGGGIHMIKSSPIIEECVIERNNDGGGICCDDSSNAIVRYCRVTQNSGGGIIFLDSSDGRVEHCIISGNISDNEGGGIHCTYSSPTLMDVSIIGNSAEDGGGISFRFCDATMVNVVVTGNSANNVGGGVSCFVADPTFTTVEVSGNSSGARGGGISFLYSGSIMTDVLVRGNIAQGDGGGIWSAYASPTMRDVIVSGNSATSGGGIFSSSTLTLVDVVLSGNYADGSGGGIHCCFRDFMGSTLTRVTVSRNSAVCGGGIACQDSISLSIINCTITENKASVEGDGIYTSPGMWGNPRLAIFRSNICYNGTGVVSLDSSWMFQFPYNWWGDATGPYHSYYNPGGFGDSLSDFINPIPFLEEPGRQAPPIPPIGLKILGAEENSITICWFTSPICDLAGYKVYFDNDSSDFPYSESVDVGLVTEYTLSHLKPGITYYIAVTCYDNSGDESWYSKEIEMIPGTPVCSETSICELPKNCALYQNYPNPFNVNSQIRYQIPEASHVTLKIFNILGQELRTLVDNDLTAGSYTAAWSGRDSHGAEVSAGIYFCTMQAGEFSQTMKMVLLR